MKILVAEDEPKVARFIEQALQEAGMTVDSVQKLEDFWSLLKTSHYDVLVLDRLLGRYDLLEKIQEIRKQSHPAKVLILSALSEVEDKVKGLTEGADDYLGKPFHVSELVARIRTLMRRPPATLEGSKNTVMTFQDLEINLETQRILRKGKKLELTGKEYRLLCLLVRHPGRIFSKMELLDQVWDMNHFPESNVVEVTIASLRSKVDKGFAPVIQSRRGAGYWLGEP